MRVRQSHQLDQYRVYIETPVAALISMLQRPRGNKDGFFYYVWDTLNRNADPFIQHVQGSHLHVRAHSKVRIFCGINPDSQQIFGNLGISDWCK